MTETAGIRLLPALTVIAAMAVFGAIVGTAFPKYEATALLQFPEVGNDRAGDLATTKRVTAS